MNAPRRLLISFEPTFGNVNLVRAAVRGVCTDVFQLPDCGASIMDFCLIATELMNNAVEHASAPSLDVELLFGEHEAVFRLITAGTGFDPTLPVAMPSVEEGEELPEGGYGLALIQALADDLEYECRGEKNMVTLRKRFPAQAGKEQ